MADKNKLFFFFFFISSKGVHRQGVTIDKASAGPKLSNVYSLVNCVRDLITKLNI